MKEFGFIIFWLLLAIIIALFVFACRSSDGEDQDHDLINDDTPLNDDAVDDDSAVDDDTTPADDDATPGDDDATPADDDTLDDDTVDISEWRWMEYQGSGPSARVMARMVYAENIGRIVMFGGGLGWPTHETWLWDGASWTEYQPVHKPGQRLAPAMAYDAGREKVVVFGGTALINFRNDTWEFDGADWIQIDPAHKPESRAQAGMVYDAERELTVLFGGCNNDECYNNLNDTWTYDGADWTLLFPANSPTPRSGGVMFYDAQMKLTIYFGGVADGKGTDETWGFDGETWVKFEPDVSPLSRYTPAGDCAAVGGFCIMFGGDGGYGPGYLNDTWMWQEGQWQELGPFDPVVSPRTQMAMAYYPPARHFVLHGGFYSTDVFPYFYGDTWLFGEPVSF